MKLRNLVFSAVCTVILAATLPSTSQVNQWQAQVTEIDLGMEVLAYPHWLTVEMAKGGQLRGNIFLDGKVIQSLATPRTEINLSSYLKRGSQVIAITGNYTPIQALVSITFVGKNRQVSQQISGSGSLHQMIVINVR